MTLQHFTATLSLDRVKHNDSSPLELNCDELLQRKYKYNGGIVISDIMPARPQTSQVVKTNLKLERCGISSKFPQILIA